MRRYDRRRRVSLSSALAMLLAVAVIAQVGSNAPANLKPGAKLVPVADFSDQQVTGVHSV
jgi:hypothetical protein